MNEIHRNIESYFVTRVLIAVTPKALDMIEYAGFGVELSSLTSILIGTLLLGSVFVGRFSIADGFFVLT